MEEGLRKDNKVWTLLQYYDTMVLYKKKNGDKNYETTIITYYNTIRTICGATYH